MNTAVNCRDLLANFFTPADYSHFKDGVPDHAALKRSWRQLGMGVQTQANMLLRFEQLSERFADLSHVHESCKDVQLRYKGCQKELAELQKAKDIEHAQLLAAEGKNKELEVTNSQQAERIKDLEARLAASEKDRAQLAKEKEDFVVQCGEGEVARHRLIRDYFPTFVRRLLQSAEYKKSLSIPFNLAIDAGWVRGIKEGRSPEAAKAIFDAAPGIDVDAPEKLFPVYDELFVKRYPFVEKVSRSYRQTSAELQNLLPDETSPTPGQGPLSETLQ